MSTEAVTWAWSQTFLEPTHKLVLLALAEDANHKGQCWPSQAHMIRRTCMPANEIGDALKALSVGGLMKSAPQENGPALHYLNLQYAAPLKPRREVVEFEAEADVVEQMEAALRLYNAMAERCKLAKVRKLTTALKAPLAARLKEGGLAMWEEALKAVEVSGHCRGFNDRGWKASFGFMLQAKSYGKLINGSYGQDYEERSNGGQRTDLAGRGDERTDRLRGIVSRNRGDPD